MKIVIQCAAGKRPDAGKLRSSDGGPVLFVADPARAPPRNAILYAHPDDPAENGKSWRENLLDYNRNPGDNVLGLLPAWQLYSNPVYGQLLRRLGETKVFILSAGWGLIRSDFLTPDYDITFSAQAEVYKRRRLREAWCDFRMLESSEDEPVAFFGGKDYRPLFCTLTDACRGRQIVVFNSAAEPQGDGIQFVRYSTSTRTNWHYEAVKAFLGGTFRVG